MNVLPKTLYKLRPLANESDWSRVSDILSSRKLWFSSVDRFNDPFEGMLSLHVRETPYRVAREWAGRVGASVATGNRATRRATIREAAKRVQHGFRVDAPLPDLNEIGICCLMETVDSLLAWSHYAAGHHGVAIGFSPRTKEPTNLFSFAHKVHYAKDKPIDDIVHDPRGRAFETALLTKAKCWEYEKEWRLVGDPMIHESVFLGARANAPAFFAAEDISEVRIGAKVSVRERERLMELLRTSGLQPRVIKASLHPSKYELVFSDLGDAPSPRAEERSNGRS
jgi:Protein of unknown function (DUF2971)